MKRSLNIFTICIILTANNSIGEEWLKHVGRPSFQYPSRFKVSNKSYKGEGFHRTLVLESPEKEVILFSDYGWISDLDAKAKGFSEPRDYFLSKEIHGATRIEKGRLEIFTNASEQLNSEFRAIRVLFLYSKAKWGQSFFTMVIRFPTGKENTIENEIREILQSVEWGYH